MTFPSLPIVLDAIAKASVILAVTALAAAALRRASASARHFVWTLGLLSTLAVPALSVALPRWELPIVRIASPEAAPTAGLPSSGGSEPAMILPPKGGSHAIGSDVMPAAAAETPAARRAVSSALGLVTWPTLALAVWLAGAAAILGRMFLGLAAVLWMSRRTPAVTDAPWMAQARALADGLRLSRVRFRRTSTSTMPMAWGVFRSSVLMPADADT